ncbi:hypothetical protein [Nonomuraea angiospora]|uniref:hypothetical protein n=1 Tax=Nonomuraea angiospora TaxID=46172 RepID=UPI0029A743CC|nr:hypothetical protein [Nonomuraea angiospora]MDX3099692.1 hypothetical protein [Nonomuraea angiospora]
MAKLPPDAETAEVNATIVALVTGRRAGLTPQQLGELLRDKLQAMIEPDYLDAIRVLNIIIGVQTVMLAELFDQFQAATGIDAGGDILQRLGRSVASERA